jgi:hypothetical protein
MKFAQPLRETLRGRAPNLVGLCVRQDVGGYPAALLTTSLTQAGGYHPRFPALFHRVSVPFLHVLKDGTAPFSMAKIMSIAARVTERFRNRLIKLVEKKRRETLCAKTAIADVARKVGMSPVNVYRVMNGYGSVTIKAHHHVALLMLTFGGAATGLASKFRKSAKSHRAELSA